jgi:hypothetical protein
MVEVVPVEASDTAGGVVQLPRSRRPKKTAGPPLGIRPLRKKSILDS